MSDIKKVLQFSEMLSNFRDISRDIELQSCGRKENDAEHSYQLAMLAWYLIATENLSLDVNKVIRYALVHDLIEVYAGDTPIFGSSEEYVNSKQQREDVAARQLENQFADFSVMHRAIEDYRKHSNQEATFVYCLDKLLPMMIIYIDGGYDWKERGISLKLIIEKVRHKVAEDQHVSNLCDAMIDCIKEKKLIPDN